MKVKSYKDLVVWQKSMDLVEQVYDLAGKIPKKEEYGLSSQMRRCVVSIPSNIAEGYRRGKGRSFVQFLQISNGSAAELETQLEIVKRVYSVDIIECEALLLEIQKMLSVLISKLKGGESKS